MKWRAIEDIWGWALNSTCMHLYVLIYPDEHEHNGHLYEFVHTCELIQILWIKKKSKFTYRGKTLYKANLKTLMREIIKEHKEEDTNCSCPKWSIRSVASLSKFQWYFSEKYKSRLKTCIELQNTWLAKAILRNQNKAGGIAFLISNYITHQAEWLCHAKEHEEQWSSAESSHTGSHIPEKLLWLKHREAQWSKLSPSKRCSEIGHLPT